MPTLEDIQALKLAGGKVIRDTWYEQLVNVLTEMYNDTSPLRGGYVVKDLIPNVDRQLNIGSQVYKFNEIWSSYSYVNVKATISNAKVQTSLVIPTTSPPSPEAGSMYFDPSTSKLYVYDGTAWKSVNLI